MMISVAMFLGLTVVLIFAFINFDRLVKIEYRQYREEWLKDRKPRGIFWVHSENNSFSSLIAMYRLTFLWLFETPKWIQNDSKLRDLLRKLRVSTLIWNIGIIVWFIINIAIIGTNS